VFILLLGFTTLPLGSEYSREKENRRRISSVSSPRGTSSRSSHLQRAERVNALDRPENNPADVHAAGAEDVPRELEMVKERETKEDGRYIIFYSFGEAREDGDG
jgi:hypothetical protein